MASGAPMETANRAQLHQRLSEAVERGRPFAVALIEIERARDVGDAALKQCAQRLLAVARDTDLVACVRPGEFVLVLDEADADALAAREQAMRAACELPLEAGSDGAEIGVRIGAAVYPRDGSDMHALLEQAGRAASGPSAAPPARRAAVRLLLVDDHAILREGLRSVFGKAGDVRVVAEASDGIEAIDRLREHDVDIVVTDLSMPRLGGLDLIRRITSEFPAVAVLALTMHGEEHYALSCFKAGARGFLHKDSASEELIAAVRQVAGGGTYVSAALAGRGWAAGQA